MTAITAPTKYEVSRKTGPEWPWILVFSSYAVCLIALLYGFGVNVQAGDVLILGP